tara:strand:+ start:15645 stop:16307 length:663 start_codon:yes stop_codon:yes gene_type:complete
MLRLVAAALISLLTAFMLNAAVAQPANYGDAMRWYEREAKKGSARAQFLLGMLYERGVPGHGKDLAKAHTWFLKAAEQGHPMAQYKVGASFHFGTGVTADRAQAVSWYRRAAGNGVAEAQHNLAHLLLNGTGTARSPDEAARWYGEAARHGFGPSQLALGYLYLQGIAVGKDPAEAWAWFRAAESRDVAGAAKARAAAGENLSPADLEKAQQMAKPRLGS